MKTNKITLWVILALFLGLGIGYACHNSLDPKAAKTVADNFALLTNVFLRMIKMIIGPLVFATLVHGIARTDSKTVGRIGAKAMVWFIGSSLISLALGLIFVDLLQPGVGYNLHLATGTLGLKTNALNLKDFLEHMFPRSFFEAMTNNEVLQIVVFSLFFGFAMNGLKGKAPHALAGVIEDLANVMLKITNVVMYFAPMGVFGAVAATITTDGLGVISMYARFMGDFMIGLMCLWVVIIAVGYYFLGKDTWRLIRAIRTPMLLGYATASSEAAYPKLLEQLEIFGVSEKIASFVLPLGYSFNLGGSMMYATFASIFISQVYNMPLSLGDQITMLLILMVTSKGIAGVPRASLVVVAAVLPMFHLPDTGILLILGIDHFLDMFRTATNVLGNAMATAVVAKSEQGSLVPNEELAQEAEA